MSVILIFGIGFSLLFSYMLYQSEKDVIMAEMQKDAERRAAAFTLSLSMKFEALHTLTALFRQNPDFSYSDFKNEAKIVLERHPDIQALEWMPIVRKEQREEYEQHLQYIHTGFTFVELDDGGNVIKAAERDFYYPVYYVEPYIGNEVALGYDMSTSAARLSSIDRAIDSGRESVTEPLMLVQESGSQTSFLMFNPVYRDGFVPFVNHREFFVGAVLGVFRIGDLYQTSEAGNIPHDVKLLLYDLTGEQKTLLHTRVHDEDKQYIGEMAYSVDIDALFDRDWRFEVFIADDYISQRMSSQPYIILILGVLLVIASAAYLDLIYKYISLIKCKNCDLQNISLRDPLTNLYNRRHFDDVLKKEWQRAIRAESSISMLVIDIDHFKRFNDSFGHMAGDLCLKEVAKAISQSMSRSNDSVFRYGGEEFAILLPNTTDPKSVAERCRQNVEALGIRHPDSVEEVVTVSVGCAFIRPEKGDDHNALFLEADRALYAAKKAGRNRVCEQLNQKDNALVGAIEFSPKD
ncbi:sensor domain-containing diguanylate cyclase [Grimontia marina]|nr:diguanylate cyclase [Grimontia marina]